MPSLTGIYSYYREASRIQGKKVENFPNCKNEVHSMASCGNPVDFFFKISPHHVNMDVPWVVGMIKTIKLPLETLLMTPWKWPIWVILHCKNCTSENFRTEGAHHFFFIFFGIPSLILTIRSYPENFIASRKCMVTPSINTVEPRVTEAVYMIVSIQFLQKQNLLIIFCLLLQEVFHNHKKQTLIYLS